jgi:large subunit ribosomal protein L35
MPKLKVHSGAKDRIKVSKNNKIRARHPNISHFMEKKSPGRKRSLAGLGTISGKASKNIKKKLGV